MSQRINNIIKGIVPPIALDIYQKLSGKTSDTSTMFGGNYKTWDEARKASGGYDTDVILNKVKDALLKVKTGEAVYERDSVLFEKVEYSWPLLAGLLWIASKNSNRLNLVDFGGSLGSTYYQNIKFLAHLDELKWSIVEQNKFVECGKRSFENNHLKFFHNLDACMRERHPDTILFSGVIQYLEKPYDLLANVLSEGFTYIIFDRTTFIEKGVDRITVQKVPAHIYSASYPAWFFNKTSFLRFFADHYELVTQFNALAGAIDLGDTLAYDEGFIFRKNP